MSRATRHIPRPSLSLTHHPLLPPAAESGLACPGACNAGYRAAEARAQRTGVENDLLPWLGDPVWCPPCTTAVRGELGELPALAGLLVQEVESGVRAGHGEPVSGSRERPVHDHEAPSMLLDETAEWLASWENTVRAARSLPGTGWSAEHGDGARDAHRDPARTITDATRFLLRHLDWILREQTQEECFVVEDFGTDLHRLHRRAQVLTAVGDLEPRRAIGVKCPNCGYKTLEFEVDASTTTARAGAFRYRPDGEIARYQPERATHPKTGLPLPSTDPKSGLPVLDLVTVEQRGAATGYIRCRRCLPEFRMTRAEYDEWTKSEDARGPLPAGADRPAAQPPEPDGADQADVPGHPDDPLVEYVGLLSPRPYLMFEEQ